MRSTFALRPEGRAVMVSPGRMVPEAIWPANPRKVWSGRSTRCTGKRNGAVRVFDARKASDSSSSSSDGPCVPRHGAWSDARCCRPASALTGTKMASTGLPVSAAI